MTHRDLEFLKIVSVEAVGVVFSLFIVKLLEQLPFSYKEAMIIVMIHIFLFYLTNHYQNFYYRERLEVVKMSVTFNLMFVSTILLAELLVGELVLVNRSELLLFGSVNAVVLFSVDWALHFYRKNIYRHTKWSRKILIIATSNRLERIFYRSKKSEFFNEKFVGIVLLDDALKGAAFYEGIPIIPKEEMFQFVSTAVVDEVFVAIPSEVHYDMSALILKFEKMGIDVSINIAVLDFKGSGKRRVQNLAGHSVVTFSTTFYDYGHIIVKRLMDIVGALIGLFVCALAAIVVVPLIKKVDGGPAIFAQNRVGKNGRIFKIYKFRSMYMDAEARKKELEKENEMDGLMFKMENDPRVTPVGKWIRRTSIDELPQFYNILIGDMSLVGTRPPTEDEYQQYTPEQKKRLSIKPGLTGLWQVSGRSDIKSFDDVLKLDVEYIDNWSIWQDIKILLKTVKVVFTGRGSM